MSPVRLFLGLKKRLNSARLATSGINDIETKLKPSRKYC